MKFNLKGIRFSTWLYFLGFSLSMMLLLGFLLVVLIKPYYRNDRIKTIDLISDTMESLLLKEDVSTADIDSIGRTVIGNNVCAVIFNEKASSRLRIRSDSCACWIGKSRSANRPTSSGKSRRN